MAILHDDDWSEPEFLERRVAFLQAHPAVRTRSADTLVDE